MCIHVQALGDLCNVYVQCLERELLQVLLHCIPGEGTKAKKLSEDALAVTVSTPMARASAEESAGGLETLLGGSSAVGVCRLCWLPSQR